jgi:hypothetical protein
MNLLTDDELPSDDGNPFCSVSQLLEIGEPVGGIASAVETAGIYTWDRFGRYQKYGVGTAEVARCLNLLATEYELRMSGLLVSNNRENFGDALDEFGWAARVLPAQQANSMQASNIEPTALKVKEKTTLLLIISALINEAAIPLDRNAASAIARRADQNGTPVSAETVRKVLKQAEDARQRRLP